LCVHLMLRSPAVRSGLEGTAKWHERGTLLIAWSIGGAASLNKQTIIPN
jgi:hypothetical protein